MGGAVSISPGSSNATVFQELLRDKKRMHDLYDEIARYGKVDGHINMTGKISMIEVILYIDKSENPIFQGVFAKEPIVAKEAFDFAVGKMDHEHELTRKEFRKLLPAMLLFSHLWKIFEVADNSIDDKRIFKHEFMSSKKTIESIEGVRVSDVTDEEWEAAFTKLDQNKSGFITFKEFCKYCVKKIISPDFYLKSGTEETDHEVVGVPSTQAENGETSSETVLPTDAPIENTPTNANILASGSKTEDQPESNSAAKSAEGISVVAPGDSPADSEVVRETTAEKQSENNTITKLTDEVSVAALGDTPAETVPSEVIGEPSIENHGV
mmetsp:Transcript_2718/g.4080  ORF Transcript_2718/g.4080 Transcript_2718/m.4080 type:complete len:325 (-) Transcript_2718:311-1285(-)